MPGRTVVFGPQYRFGFNGKENDNEVKGPGNQQDYGMRIYDTRIGRFLSIDPLQTQYPELTPYQFASNTPVQAIDLDGLEQHHFSLIYDEQGRPCLSHTGDENFTEWQWRPGGTGVFNWWLWRKIENPREEYWVTFKYRTHTVTEALAFEHDAAVGVKYSVDPTTLPLDQVTRDIGNALEAKGAKQAFLQGLSGNLSTGLRTPTRGNSKAASTPSPSTGVNNQVTRANSGNTQPAEVNISIKKAQQLNVNKQNSFASESIVKNRLIAGLGQGEILLDKPRIYIGDGTNLKNYAVPDYAVFNTETKRITRIIDAKDGGGGLSTKQRELNQKGGVFFGSSRYKNIKRGSYKVDPGKVEQDKTNVAAGASN